MLFLCYHTEKSLVAEVSASSRKNAGKPYSSLTAAALRCRVVKDKSATGV
jgi:hypothetical protein